MGKIAELIDGVTNFSGVIAGIAMLLGVALVIGEILMRIAFNSTLYITEEYTAYLMVAITFLGLSYALKEKAHIRMVFLPKLLKGRALTSLDIYCYVIGIIIFALITYSTYNYFWDSFINKSRSMQISKTYLAIPQFLMPLGSLTMTLQFAAELIRSIAKLRTGEEVKANLESEFQGR